MSTRYAGGYRIANMGSLEVGTLFHKKSSTGKTFVLLIQNDDPNGPSDGSIWYAEWGGSDPVGKFRSTRKEPDVLVIDTPPVLVDQDYGQITSGHGTGSMGNLRRYVRAASN